MPSYSSFPHPLRRDPAPRPVRFRLPGSPVVPVADGDRHGDGGVTGAQLAAHDAVTTIAVRGLCYTRCPLAAIRAVRSQAVIRRPPSVAPHRPCRNARAWRCGTGVRNCGGAGQPLRRRVEYCRELGAALDGRQVADFPSRGSDGAPALPPRRSRRLGTRASALSGRGSDRDSGRGSCSDSGRGSDGDSDRASECLAMRTSSRSA